MAAIQDAAAIAGRLYTLELQPTAVINVALVVYV